MRGDKGDTMTKAMWIPDGVLEEKMYVYGKTGEI